MIHTLTLSDEEAEELERIMEQRCQDLLLESNRTDSRQFKDKIQRERNICQRIYEQLETRYTTHSP